MAISRREFIENSLKLAAASTISGPSFADPIESLLPAAWSNDIPPLFCTAYIDPTLAPQMGQEEIVAKYPLALVPQNSGLAFRRWRDKIRQLNPSIKLLAYQMVIEETTVPGPGHDIVRKINNNNVWATYPGGIISTVTWDQKPHRVYDPRSTIWQDAFLDACATTYHNYPYDGLLLDNCTVYTMAALLPSIRSEMLAALSEVLVQLRKRLPQAIIIGNSSTRFPALNGSMNENRPKDLTAEATVTIQHPPIFNLSQLITDSRNPDNSLVKSSLEIALSNQFFFGVAAPNYQTAFWSPLFDQVVTAYNSPSAVKSFLVNPNQ